MVRSLVLPLLFAVTVTPAKEPPERGSFTQTVEVAVALDGGPAVGRRLAVDLVYVPGGEFTMGSPDGEPGRAPNEGPRHKVRVGGFWMGKCEVTWDEFDVFRDDTRFPRGNDAPARKPAADAVTRPTPSHVDETYDHGRAGERTRPTRSATTRRGWASTRGTGRRLRTPTTPRARPTRSGRRSPTRSGCTTCTGTWPSGPLTGTTRKRTRPGRRTR